jgi:hypothetical protein
MEDLRPGHTGHSETERPLAKGLKEFLLPVWIRKFINDLNIITLTVKRGSDAKET